jgi:hypothetical protein
MTNYLPRTRSRTSGSLVVHATLVMACLTGCYTGAPTTRDVNASWRARHVSEIEARWGAPARRESAGPDAALTWSHAVLHVSLPSGGASVEARPVTAGASIDSPIGTGSITVQTTAIEVASAFRPGEVWKTTTEAAALVNAAGVITRVDGASLRWGPPNDANLHWGTIFGLHAGMGRLDTTSTPLPSGGLYIGGMLTPTLGLIGDFSLAAGSDDAGGAIGFGWGVAAKWWPVNRLSLHAGPAMLLTLDPGFTDAAFHPGVTTGASYAVVKVGVFALDVRFDLDAGASVAFGSVGIGVNVN